MAWLAVDKTGTECIFENIPERDMIISQWDNISHTIYSDPSYNVNTVITLPYGTIKKLIGRNLTWEDEPVELRRNKLCGWREI